MTTAWFTRHVGDGKAPNVRVDALSDDPSVLLIHSGKADWTKDPLTGNPVRVLAQGAHTMPCPKCKTECVDADVMIAEVDGKPDMKWVIVPCVVCKGFVGAQIPRNKAP